MSAELGNILFYLLPAILVAGISFYFFKLHIDNEEKRRSYLLHLENQKQAFPLRLQAYERMTLFLERISPGNLLIRIKPVGPLKEEYTNLLTSTIEQEFEHNLAQQIYVSNECWNVIRTAKSATINTIRKASKDEGVASANDLRKHILSSLMDQEVASQTALIYIKKEVKELF